MLNESAWYGTVLAINAANFIENWIRVTRYDPQKNTLEGRFEANLIDSKMNSTESTGRVAQFNQGHFIVKLPKK